MFFIKISHYHILPNCLNTIKQSLFITIGLTESSIERRIKIRSMVFMCYVDKLPDSNRFNILFR